MATSLRHETVDRELIHNCLRDDEGEIEDGIADESLGRVLKQEIAALKKMRVVTDYVRAVEKLRALLGVKPFEGDEMILSVTSNAESAKILSEAKKRSREKAQEACRDRSRGHHQKH